MGYMGCNLQSINSQTSLDLNDKLLIGPIPPLPGIFNLKLLDLSHNQLTGELPETHEARQPRNLRVSDNQLEGQIPRRSRRCTSRSSTSRGTTRRPDPAQARRSSA